jgi:NAD(P)-dependent dehydrogenase (short-subunit alcohol dehydrogenase family)
LRQMDFKGRSVIITGASGGIGSETARSFAEKGVNITVNYFSSPEKAEKTVKTVRSLIAEAFPIKSDVSNPEEVFLMIKEITDKFGRARGKQFRSMAAIDYLDSRASLQIPEDVKTKDLLLH